MDKKKYDELLKKEKNYNKLKIKYKELLKELNELKNKIALNQNFNMINNKNQIVHKNILPKKEKKRKNNLLIENKNIVQVLKEKNKMGIETIFKVSNLFYFLTGMRKFHLKYYYKKFMFYMTNMFYIIVLK